MIDTQHTVNTITFNNLTLLANCTCSFIKHLLQSVKITFQAQDGATPIHSATSANQNLSNFQVPVNALLEEKCSISSEPVPKLQVNSRPSHPRQGRLTLWPQPVRYYFCLLCSLFFNPKKASCLLPHFAVLQKETVHFLTC